MYISSMNRGCNIYKSNIGFKNSSFPFVEKKLAKPIYEGYFFNTLVEYVKKADYKPDRNNLVVLNAGCGEGTDTQCLVSYFGKKDYGQNSNDVRIYGVDKDLADIRSAKKANKHLKNNAIFIEDYVDSAIEKTSELKNNIDVALIRHPNIDRYTEKWLDTLGTCHKNLRNGGIMIITTLNDNEMSPVRQFVSEKKFNKVIDEKNSSNYFMDDRIMIIKKP